VEDSGVGRYVQELAEQGSVDSEGVFTIGWDRAVEKLRTFQAGDEDAFLLYLVSAGCAYGARNISIEDNSKHLKVTMHATYVTEQDIGRGFQSIASGRTDNQALDLGMGLHGGLRGTVDEVELLAEHPTLGCFCWRLTRSTEKAGPRPAISGEPRVTVTFRRKARTRLPVSLWEKLFGSADSAHGLGGYAGMSGPCRQVDRRCERSPIPISINSQLVNRPLVLPHAPVGAVSSSLRGVRIHSARVIKLDHFDWQGALVFQNGPLHLVVNGVSYPSLKHESLSGTVWAALNRDLSRQRIVEDEKFQKLNQELEHLVEQMARVEAELLDSGDAQATGGMSVD
jgi:hypothetical protein